MTDQEAAQLAGDLEFARSMRRSQRNTLVARLPICLIWGFVLAVAGFIRDLGGVYLWLLMPLVLASSIVTMIIGARLRHNSGELTTGMDRRTSIVWAIAGPAMLAALLALPLGNWVPLVFLGLLAASHLLAGVILETSYLITAGTVSIGILLWVLMPAGFSTENPAMLLGLIAGACIVLGALLGKAVCSHGR
jgi:hypothetical protein